MDPYRHPSHLLRSHRSSLSCSEERSSSPPPEYPFVHVRPLPSERSNETNAGDLVTGRSAQEGRIQDPLLLRHQPRLVPHRFVQLGKRAPEPVPRIRLPAFLFLGNGVLYDLRPEHSMFVVPCSQSAVLFLRKRVPFLAACFLEEGFPVWEVGADSGRVAGLGVRVVLFVHV